jgi:formamidopyrimidine-DNA glycosylase
MPELPEVETISRFLKEGNSQQSPVLGRTIQRVELLWERSVAEPAAAEFLERLPGQTIAGIGRRGKYLRLDLSEDVLLFHLRMSGDLLVEPVDAPIGPHYRLLLYLDQNLRLAFHDTRKFGRVWLTQDPQHVFQNLGPEPLNPELTAADFYARLQRHHRQLKPLLMDQSFLAGLGNIYTDEALHMARLHPLAISDKLTEEQAARLLAAIRKALSEGIRRNGTSIDWVYRGGDYQRYLQVYQRTGEPCKTCGTPIERIIVGQRSTHFCPNCQPLP